MIKIALKTAIKQSERSCFLNICDDLENISLAYKILMKKLKQEKSFKPSESQKFGNMVTHLFPFQGAT